MAEYKEHVQYEEGDDLSRTTSLNLTAQTDDIQARLVQAAQPLDFQAPLEAKFQSYDAYCSLFHFILNSEGPVDLEPPSVGLTKLDVELDRANKIFCSTTGLGMLSMSSFTSSTLSPRTVCELPGKQPTRRSARLSARTPTPGAATVFSTSCTPSFSDPRSPSSSQP